MGILFKFDLECEPGDTAFLCAVCGTPLVSESCLVSKQFRGRTGSAYLFTSVRNVLFGDAEETQMTTGAHTVRPLYCVDCGECLGWSYLEALDHDQKYKEGKYILERHLMKRAVLSESGMEWKKVRSDEQERLLESSLSRDVLELLNPLNWRHRVLRRPTSHPG